MEQGRSARFLGSYHKTFGMRPIQRTTEAASKLCCQFDTDAVLAAIPAGMVTWLFAQGGCPPIRT
jgi:hypothetical protein